MTGPGTSDDADTPAHGEDAFAEEAATRAAWTQGAGAAGADAAGAADVEEDIDVLLAAARRERDEYLDMVRRVQADFENYKKRMDRQQRDLIDRAAENLVVKVLPVLDAFDLARAHLGEADEPTPEGKALVQASALLSDTLAREGLERIDEPGAPFDPQMHEAVDQVPATEGPGAAGAPESAPDPAAGPVVDGVLRAGYRYKGRVIRPAMVRVRG